MAMFTQLTDTTSYSLIIGALFVMGLGMGGTMMPMMAAALATLTAHTTARGSTLLNISQQVASSMGVAIISVVLTNGLKNDELVSQAEAFGQASAADPNNTALLQQFPLVGEILARFGNDAAAGQAADGDVQLLRHHGAGVRTVAAQLGEPLRRVRLEFGEFLAGDGRILELLRCCGQVDAKFLGNGGRLHGLGVCRGHASRVSGQSLTGHRH